MAFKDKEYILMANWEDVAMRKFQALEILAKLMRIIDKEFNKCLICEGHRERVCYKCKRAIAYCEFIRPYHVNRLIDEGYYTKVWDSEVIELYCCECYAKLAMIKKAEQVIRLVGEPFG